MRGRVRRAGAVSPPLTLQRMRRGTQTARRPNGDQAPAADSALRRRNPDQGADAPRSPLPDWLRKTIDASSEQHCLPAASSLADCALPSLVRKLARLHELETQFQERLQADRLEAMAELAAGAGHEINNPIAVIAGRGAFVPARDATRTPPRVSRDERPGDAGLRNDLGHDALRPAAAAENRGLRSRCTHHASAGQLGPAGRTADRSGKPWDRRAAHNSSRSRPARRGAEALLENALESMPQGGRIDVRLRRISPAARNGDSVDQIELIVRDNGPGISPEIRLRMFDPFYSGRSAGRGLGMGLSKCWRIITNHGGRIEVESELGRGAMFTIRLPVEREDGSQKAAITLTRESIRLVPVHSSLLARGPPVCCRHNKGVGSRNESTSLRLASLSHDLRTVLTRFPGAIQSYRPGSRKRSQDHNQVVAASSNCGSRSPLPTATGFAAPTHESAFDCDAVGFAGHHPPKGCCGACS